LPVYCCTHRIMPSSPSSQNPFAYILHHSIHACDCSARVWLLAGVECTGCSRRGAGHGCQVPTKCCFHFICLWYKQAGPAALRLTMFTMLAVRQLSATLSESAYICLSEYLFVCCSVHLFVRPSCPPSCSALIDIKQAFFHGSTQALPVAFKCTSRW